MAWPPPVLPTNQTNATPQQDTHAQDHSRANLAINDTVTHVIALEQGVNAVFDAMISGQQEGAGARFRMYTAGVAATTDAAGSVTVAIPAGVFNQNPLFAIADDFYTGQAPGTPSTWVDFKVDGSVFTKTSVRLLVAGRVSNAAVVNTPVGFRFVAFGRWS